MSGCLDFSWDHLIPRHSPLLCPRFLSHMKAQPEDLKPPCFPSSKSKRLPPYQGKPIRHSTTARTSKKLTGIRENRRYEDFHQDTMERLSAAVAPCLSFSSTTPLPKITPKPGSRITTDSERPEDDVLLSIPRSSPHTFSAVVQDTVFKTEEASLSKTTNTNFLKQPCPAEQESLQSPYSPCHSSLSDSSRPTSLFSHSLDLSGRSSILSDKSSADSRSTSPEGIICSPLVHSLHVLLSPVPPRHAPLPLHSQTNLCTPALISTKFNGQTKTPSLPQTSSVPLCEPEGDKSNVQEGAIEPCHKTVPCASRSSSHPSPLTSSADILSFKPSTSSPVQSLRPLWPILPAISSVQEWHIAAACCSSEVSDSESQIFDELDAVAPLSASSSSVDQVSELSNAASNETDVSLGLAALTVGCDSGNLSSLSRVQLLMLNRQEPDAASPFSLDDELLHLDNNTDLEMNNGVWRPPTAGSISEKCGSVEKEHQNKLDDLEECSGSPCSWIIDPSPSYMFKSPVSKCSSYSGYSEDEEAPFDTQTDSSTLDAEGKETCSTIRRIDDDRFRKREERKTKVLKMLSKLQDDSPHEPASCQGHSNFEDFDFLAKYCIFNQVKLAEYRRAFEEEDTDGDGYISCLQVMFALKSITPPELLSEEEEIYVYRILEMVDFRVTDGLVDLRLFAVIASLAQKIATMDEFMRSLISSIDFHSLEVKLFKAKKLFLFLLEGQADDGLSDQKYISPEQLILELKAGGIFLEQEANIREELKHIPPLDLLDFLAYLPLFMLIHRSVIANPLDDF